MNILGSVLEAVGKTPLVRLNRVGSETKATLLAKLEYTNPGGSVKDRIALTIVEKAERDGLLQPGGTIVEATSGNTGMGLAMVAAVRGYKCVFVMPDKMSQEKIKALRAAGARVVVTPTDVAPEDPRSYYCVSRRIAEETPGAFYANQYHNPDNPDAHYQTTGPEIWEQTGGKVDVLCIASGTGGTITGCAKYLRERNPELRVVVADPIGSIYYDWFHTGKITEASSYKVEGFGEDFLPSTMDFSFVDDVVRVTDKECFDLARRLAREEGIFSGGSAGGAVAAAIRYAEKNPRPLTIVTIMPDSAMRYLSKVYDDDWMRENGFLGDDRLAHGTVADLLAGRAGSELRTAQLGQAVRDVISAFREHGISQMPVLDGTRVTGIVNERDLLEFLVRGGDASAPIDTCVETRFATVEPSMKVSVLGQLFTRDLTVLVITGGKLSGIITRIDFIDFVARALN